MAFLSIKCCFICVSHLISMVQYNVWNIIYVLFLRLVSRDLGFHCGMLCYRWLQCMIMKYSGIIFYYVHYGDCLVYFS